MLNIAKVQKIFKHENFTPLFSILWPAISFILGLHSTAKSIIFGARKPLIGPPLFPFHTLIRLQNGSGGTVGTRASYNLFPRLLVYCQLKRERTHRPCIPTYIQTDRSIGNTDNQRLAPRVSISPISPCNLTHISAQYGPYYHAIPAILHTNRTEPEMWVNQKAGLLHVYFLLKTDK